MAFRGGGRGRGGRGGYSGPRAKEEKFQVFPDIKELPDVNLKQIGEDFRSLVSWGNELQKFWISSPYHLGAVGQVAEKNADIFPMMTREYFPAELVAGKVTRINKKIRWDPQSDLQRLDIFEKLDQGPQGQEDGDREKKDDDEEDEDNENFDEDEEDSGDDYAQNIDFDDDEDDFNMAEDHGGDEGFY